MKSASSSRPVLLAASLATAAQGQWTLVDDFDDYDTSTVTTIGANGAGDATGGAWDGVFDGTGNAMVLDDPDGEGAGDQMLEVWGIPGQGAGGWRGAVTDLSSHASGDLTIGHNTSATVFFRFRAASGGGNFDCMFGLTDSPADLDTNNAWQDFAVMPFLAGGGGGEADFRADPGGTAIADVPGDTWHNVWLVIDNAAKSFDIHTSTGSAGGILRVSGASYRNGLGSGDLAAFGIAERESGHVQIDDIYLDLSGQNLTHPVPVIDTDEDGLPDWWEEENELDPGDATGDNGATGDPDDDTIDNLAEFQAGSDPQVAASVPGDTDGDGLQDDWEWLWFGGDDQDGGGDPDGDGEDNLAEQAAGSDPTSSFSTPDDTDGDSLADDWEQLHFGNLDAGAYEDPDADGFTNQAESIAATVPDDGGSRPAWKSPAVGWTRDSVIATDAYMLDTGAPYGRVVNGVAHQGTTLLTFGAYQYGAWYDYDELADRSFVVLARRSVDGAGVGAWEIFPTGSEFIRGFENDNHNAITLGICPADGTLHLSWDHHGHDLRYRRSVLGLCTDNTAAWGSGMLHPEQSHLDPSLQTVGGVTYPHFVTSPAGGLVLTWRTGTSGDGDQLLSTYLPGTEDPADGVWTPGRVFIGRGGSYGGSNERCPYINGLDFDPDGTIHVTWTWRETPSSSNHDICYAWSEDGGATWRNRAGAVIADTGPGGRIDLDSPGIVFKPLDEQQLLINQQSQCVDREGRVHAMMMHRRGDDPVGTAASYSQRGTAYHHYYLEPGGRWQERRIPPDVLPPGSRPCIGHDADGNLYAVYLSYDEPFDIVPGRGVGALAVASASAASHYSDWRLVSALEVANEFGGEPLIDPDRLVEDGVLSVYIQENRPDDNGDTTAPLHVHEFIVGVAEPVAAGSITLSRSGDDAVVSVFGEAGSNHGLETNTDLSGDWTPVGPMVPGQGVLLSFPHVDGLLDDWRFYRVTSESP